MDMGIEVIVPENLIFEELQKQFPVDALPLGRKSIPYLYYICSELVKIRSMYGCKHPEYEDYFPMSSSRMRLGIHQHYDKYISYLITAKVFQTDDAFIIGRKCRGYKFSEQYNGTNLRHITLDDYKLAKKIRTQQKKFIKEKAKELGDHMHLIKWYLDGGLEIDAEAANKWVDQYRKNEENKFCASNTSEEKRTKDLKELVNKCEGWKMFIHKIHHHSFGITDFTVCEFGRRFHGLLTYLLADLRGFITYRGQRLVSVDIKNSQPYFLIGLLV